MCNKKAKKIKDSFDAGFLIGFSVNCHLSARILSRLYRIAILSSCERA